MPLIALSASLAVVLLGADPVPPAAAPAAEAGSAAAQAAEAGSAAAPAAEAGSAADLARFEALWGRRDDPEAATELQKLEGEFEDSNDYDKLWRVARWYFWTSDGDVAKNRKEFLGKNGWAVGERAKKLNPSGIEAKYWTSTCIGAYSESVGILTALSEGLESKFRDPLLEAVKLDPGYTNANVNYVGPETALGRYFDRLPWPKHDEGKAKEWLQRAIAAHPESLRSHYFLADAIKGDDRPTAKKELQLVLDGSESYDPPEARRVKRQARALLTELSK